MPASTCAGGRRSAVRVKVVARTTRGKVLRDTRVYRTCVPTRKKKR